MDRMTWLLSLSAGDLVDCRYGNYGRVALDDISTNDSTCASRVKVCLKGVWMDSFWIDRIPGEFVK